MKRRYCLSLFALASIGLAIVGCTTAKSQGETVMDESPAPTTPEPKAETRPGAQKPVDPRLVAANNDFGLRLFAKLRGDEKNANLLISPLSIAIALNMTYDGAAGETQKQMAQALGLDAMPLADVNAANAALKQNLEGADPGIEVAIANSLWARQGVNFRAEFLDAARRHFAARVTTLDFGNPDAAGTINDWVKQNTRGKIEKIVSDPVGRDVVMYLINAVYFKGQWQYKFDPKLTEDADFHSAAGATRKVRMMQQHGKYRYLKGDNFASVALPYGKGGMSLYLVLPDEDVSLDNLLDRLDAVTWNQWVGRMPQREGEVKIPRFKLTYEKSLNDALQAIGMEAAFDARQADFSGMRQERDLFISQVKHKAMMEVNEEGTVAAAATSVEMSRTSVINPQEPFTFTADRPFLAVLRDNKSGSILFLTTVQEP